MLLEPSGNTRKAGCVRLGFHCAMWGRAGSAPWYTRLRCDSVWLCPPPRQEPELVTSRSRSQQCRTPGQTRQLLLESGHPHLITGGSYHSLWPSPHSTRGHLTGTEEALWGKFIRDSSETLLFLSPLKGKILRTRAKENHCSARQPVCGPGKGHLWQGKDRQTLPQ